MPDNLLSITLNDLIDLLSLQAAHSDNVFWIRSADYEEQFYVSPAYERIWGVSVQELYENPHSWNQYLALEDPDHFVNRLAQRNSPNNQNNTAIFAICTKLGEKKWIKDFACRLYNVKQQCIAIAGIGTVIPETEMTEYQHDQWQQQILQEKNNYLNLLQKLLCCESALPPRQPQLSNREQQCVDYLAQGFTTKAIAQELALSCRTIDAYIESIKNKLNCANRLEIMAKLRHKHA